MLPNMHSYGFLYLSSMVLVYILKPFLNKIKTFFIPVYNKSSSSKLIKFISKKIINTQNKIEKVSQKGKKNAAK